ncbi:MAG: hypothetical protein ACUVUS_09545 [Thermoproteota archaeon]
MVKANPNKNIILAVHDYLSNAYPILSAQSWQPAYIFEDPTDVKLVLAGHLHFRAWYYQETNKSPPVSIVPAAKDGYIYIITVKDEVITSTVYNVLLDQVIDVKTAPIRRNSGHSSKDSLVTETNATVNADSGEIRAVWGKDYAGAILLALGVCFLTVLLYKEWKNLGIECSIP